jgi:hypothetical protein
MAEPISSYLVDDLYAPLTPKPSLQQYDNYQTYDVYCLDYVKSSSRRYWDSRRYYIYNGGRVVLYNDFFVESIENIGFTEIPSNVYLAVSKYLPQIPTFDFRQLINKHHSVTPRTYTTTEYSNTAVIISQQDVTDPANTISFSSANTSQSTTLYVLYAKQSTQTSTARPPSYIDFLDGYNLDNLIKTNSHARFRLQKSELITISYWRENKLESVPNIRSIDSVNYQIDCLADNYYYLDLSEVVLSTLNISSVEATNQVKSILLSDRYYQYSDYFIGSDDNLITRWITLYELSDPIQPAPPVPIINTYQWGSTSTGYIPIEYQNQYNTPVIFEIVSNTFSQNILRKLAANNIWNNDDSENLDINSKVSHPMFEVDNQRAYNWHIKTQTDGSYGDLIMNSPEIKEIHAALNAAKYSRNTLDPTKQRVSNLGHLIEKASYLLGYRPEPDGTFKPDTEKSRVRKVIDSNTQLDPAKIGVNNFGADGMVVKRINNRFSKNEVVADQCVIVHDLLQLIAEYHDQLDLALGVQESSAVELKDGATTARYPNQLAMMTELLNLVNTVNEMTRSILVSSLVSQAQSNELIAGLGLPSVTKTIPIKMDNKTNQLPYKGIAGHRSISQEIATCTANVGIVLGQLI